MPPPPSRISRDDTAMVRRSGKSAGMASRAGASRASSNDGMTTVRWPMQKFT